MFLFSDSTSSDSPSSSTPGDQCSLDGCLIQDFTLLEDYVLDLNRALTNEDMLDEVNNTWCDPDVNLLPFGALASDWSRLLLLQQAQPTDSILRDNLLRLSRLLIVAYFQDSATTSESSIQSTNQGLGDESDERSTIRIPSVETESPAQQANNVTTLDSYSSGTDNNESIGSSKSIESTVSLLDYNQTVAPSIQGSTFEQILTTGENNSNSNEAVHDRSKENFMKSRKNIDSEDSEVAKFFESEDLERPGIEEMKQSRDSSEGDQLTASMEELLDIAKKQEENGTDSAEETTNLEGFDTINSNLTDTQSTKDSEEAETSSDLTDSSPNDGLSLLNEVNALEDAKPVVNDTSDSLEQLVVEAKNITENLESSTLENEIQSSSVLLDDLITSKTDDQTTKLDSIEEFFKNSGGDINDTLNLSDNSSEPDRFSGQLKNSTTTETSATVPELSSIQEFFNRAGEHFNETKNLGDDDSSASLEETSFPGIALEDVTNKTDDSEQNDDLEMSVSIEELIKQLDNSTAGRSDEDIANITKTIEKFFEESGGDIDNINLSTDEPHLEESSRLPDRSMELLLNSSSTLESTFPDSSSLNNVSLETMDTDISKNGGSTGDLADLPQLQVIFNESSGDAADSISDESLDMSNLEGLSGEKNPEAKLDSGSVDRLLTMGAGSMLKDGRGLHTHSRKLLESANPNNETELQANNEKNVWWPNAVAQRGVTSGESSSTGELDNIARTEEKDQEPLSLL
ncbi:hypothetical protein QAD02_005089 [Eretmocerus hayati]|uniref:Uncharacterized protein n=1 Tax=Eretmocerus hayati TaxID=131215 RepID=A0ACC2NUB7_9HYME|nr:hypothetical protein QAD02_005089 [Eretmocerus hayati]